MYTDILKKVMNLDNIEEVCVKIDLRDIYYPLTYISYEDFKYLVVDSVGDDEIMRKVIIPKSEIESISIVYQEDIDSMFENDDNKEKDMYV